MNSKIIIRPIQHTDQPAILEIVGTTGPGFNFWSTDVENMKIKIKHSIDSFAEKTEIHNRTYLFVMENLENQEIVGTASIEAAAGGLLWPFYKYKLSNIIQISPTINQSKKHSILYLVSDHEGASELGALYLKPTYRGAGLGSFLSRTRCLFIAEFSHLFADRIIADMRGISNNAGISPFWEGLARHFFGNITYEEACNIKAIKGSQFLLDLVPHYPIYVDLLPEITQQAIGRTHENTTPALHILEREGFLFENYIDVFDGGPTIECYKGKIQTVRESQKAILVDCKNEINSTSVTLVSNTELDFRAMVTAIEIIETGKVILEAEVAERLNIAIGDCIRYCHFR